MNNKSKSKPKISPFKSPSKKIVTNQEPLLKGKWDQIQSNKKQIKSAKSLSARPSQSKSASGNKLTQQTINLNISKQYTRSTYQRYQQKLSIQTKMQQLIKQIKDRQNILKGYFQIYRLLDSQIGQQRCLQHNNDLSLYCLTQNKVLCVHCIYGQSKHKTHKVMPLKDCVKDVNIDIMRLQSNIKRQIQTIKQKIKTSEVNQKFLERHFHIQLQQLQKIYTQKLRLIQIEYCEKKSFVNEYFQSLKCKNNELIKALRQFEKQIQLKLGTINKDDTGPKHEIKIVSKQTILSKISQLSNLNGIALQDMNQKDIHQSHLRNRIIKPTKK